jgi:GGDEF domain-containing protein
VGDALVDVVRGVARDADVCVSASIGVAVFDSERSGDDVIAAADASMYAAKAAGGDRVTVEIRPAGRQQ